MSSLSSLSQKGSVVCLMVLFSSWHVHGMRQRVILKGRTGTSGDDDKVSLIEAQAKRPWCSPYVFSTMKTKIYHFEMVIPDAEATTSNFSDVLNSRHVAVAFVRDPEAPRLYINEGYTWSVAKANQSASIKPGTIVIGTQFVEEAGEETRWELLPQGGHKQSSTLYKLNDAVSVEVEHAGPDGKVPLFKINFASDDFELAGGAFLDPVEKDLLKAKDMQDNLLRVGDVIKARSGNEYIREYVEGFEDGPKTTRQIVYYKEGYEGTVTKIYQDAEGAWMFSAEWHRTRKSTTGHDSINWKQHFDMVKRHVEDPEADASMAGRLGKRAAWLGAIPAAYVGASIGFAKGAAIAAGAQIHTVGIFTLVSMAQYGIMQTFPYVFLLASGVGVGVVGALGAYGVGALIGSGWDLYQSHKLEKEKVMAAGEKIFNKLWCLDQFRRCGENMLVKADATCP